MDCCASLDPTSQPQDLIALLVLGFTISLGHCVGMCGPLVTAFALAQQKSRAALCGRLVVYHLGRVLTYALIGAVAGTVGASLGLVGDTRQVQGGISLVIGLMMLFFALQLLGRLPLPASLRSGRFTELVSCRIRGLLQAQTLPRSFGLGFANGWLPCGPVAAAAFTAAATASTFKGAVAMGAFGAGTLPVLVALGMGAGLIGARVRRAFHHIGAAVLVIMGAQLILRGLAAWGLVAHLRFGEVVIW